MKPSFVHHIIYIVPYLDFESHHDLERSESLQSFDSFDSLHSLPTYDQFTANQELYPPTSTNFVNKQQEVSSTTSITT